jgi:PilZ domain
MEKRKNERFKAYEIPISGNLLFSQNVSILDISFDGISVNSEKGMKPGKECIVKIKANDKIVPLRVTVVWCTLKESRKMFNGDVAPVYTIGFRLNNGGAEIKEIIESLCLAEAAL